MPKTNKNAFRIINQKDIKTGLQKLRENKLKVIKKNNSSKSDLQDSKVRFLLMLYSKFQRQYRLN